MNLVGLRLVALGILSLVALNGCARETPTPLPIPTVSTAGVTAEPTDIPPDTATPARRATSTPAATETPVPTPTRFMTPPAEGESVNIPILMYHHLKYREANASAVLKTWSVAPDQFAAQLDYFLERGFQTITFKQLVDFMHGDAPLPEKPMLLTFDDGWIDSYTVAFPELKKRGMVGNFFVPTRYADAGGELLMNWDQILEMDRAGMEIDGHTINHEDLTKVNLDVLERELGGAKKLMEDKLGHPTYALSYPFGAFNPRVMAATEAAGYRAAVILCCGYKQSADILFALPRIRISYDDTIKEIGSKLP